MGVTKWLSDIFGPRVPKCYLVYERDNVRYAEALTRELEHQGIEVWMDRHTLTGGEAWIEATREAVNRADAIIYVLTLAAVQSPHVHMQVEVAARLDLPIVPIVFNNVPFDAVMPILAPWQWIREDAEALKIGRPSQLTVSNIVAALNAASKFELRDHRVQPRPPEPRRTEDRPLNEGKLILVGRGEVGKTSLVNRLITNSFHGDEAKTHGINITRWTLDDGYDAVRLNVWDFGGQEIMHATHQFFLTERSIYVLVLNGREGGEDADAEYWLKHIQSFGGTSPVIVAQNKISQHPFELNYRGLQSRYPQIHGFVKTDCETGVGITELRSLIDEVVAEMPEIRDPFPGDWFEVKERLESTDDEVMSYDEFRRLCEDAGLNNEKDRDTLSFFLHCLGIALNYRDDPRLRETSVLKPKWVTEGIYKILNAPQLAKRQGELRLQDLRDILPAARYPVHRHLFLVELMRKFSLCFPFSEASDRYLIPELLGKEEPEEIGQFAPEKCLNFEYHYGVLPEGLMPRFIVRSHTLSQGQARWRSGVILVHEHSKALVVAVASEKRIVVRIKDGDEDSRRRLLAVIRYDLERIHGEFKDRLDAQAKVPIPEHPAVSIDYSKLVAFEKKNVDRVHDVVADDVVEVSVQDLLDRVDLQGQRAAMTDPLTQAKAVFVSYSHKDEILRDELETHLKLLQRLGIISIWHDRKIMAGTDWEKELDNRVERARIILLLISVDFLASDYCWSKEMSRAMERHAAGQAKVVPIMLRTCDWKGAPFEALQGLPPDMKPVTSYADRDVAWTSVATGIRTLAAALT